MSNQNQYPDTNIEHVEHLGLQGTLASFEGTAMAPLIKDSLTAAGIDPTVYNPADFNHAHYQGFVADSVNASVSPNSTASPIIKSIEDGLRDGSIVVERPEYGTVQLHPWSGYPADGATEFGPNARQTSKLDTIGMLQLNDAKTGAILAYAPRLGTDGGRPGRAIISTNDVTTGHEKY